MKSADLTAADRAAYIDDLVPPTAAVMSPLFDQFVPNEADIARLRGQNAASDVEHNGLQLAFYSGVAVAQRMQTQITERRLDHIFRGDSRTALQFAYHNRPGDFVEGHLRSILTSPALFASLVALSALNIAPPEMRGADVPDLPVHVVTGILRAPWFHDLLRAASVTAPNLYRNSIRSNQRYGHFASRSVIGAVQQYADHSPNGQQPVLIEQDGEGAIIHAELSPDFTVFLSDRMRAHNAAVHAHTHLRDGKTQACPFAHDEHAVRNAHILPSSAGYTAGQTTTGKAKIRLTRDFYRDASLLVADMMDAVMQQPAKHPS